MRIFSEDKVASADSKNNTSLSQLFPPMKVNKIVEKSPLITKPPVYHQSYTHDTTNRHYKSPRTIALGTNKDKYIDMGYKNEISTMNRINKSGCSIDYPGMNSDNCLV